MKSVVLMLMFAISSSIGYVSSSSEALWMCFPKSNSFIHDLSLQCPNSIPLPLPVEVDGESIDTVLRSSQTNVYTAVLFYASWCPFSVGVQSQFASLSSMFPQIKHLMVEQSSASPSVFSRYGIHSVPTIIMVNHTRRVRYHGPKDLSSYVQFYVRTTDLDPVVDLTQDQIHSNSGPRVGQPWYKNPTNEIFAREPYLVLSTIFLFLKASSYFFPKIVSHLTSLWATFIPHPNLGIFGDSRQILGRILHLIDVKRFLTKLKLSKIRNFHKGARSARVWASSLASVSLGEASSVRATPSEGL